MITVHKTVISLYRYELTMAGMHNIGGPLDDKGFEAFLKT
jgi:hypothetical protein